MDTEVKNDTPLKELIVNFVGNKLNPENDEVTIDHIAEVFSQEFPEFLLTLALFSKKTHFFPKKL